MSHRRIVVRNLGIATALIVALTACSSSSRRVLPVPTTLPLATSSTTVPSACSTSTVAASESLPIAGTLELVGGPIAQVDRVSGLVTAVSRSGERCNVNVGGDGEFVMYVNPGIYALTGHSPKYENGSSQCSAGGPVVVAARPSPSPVPPPVIRVDCQRR
jgi:hypothetical protein